MSSPQPPTGRTATCALCNWRRGLDDLAIVVDDDGTQHLCHGAWDKSPTCYDRYNLQHAYNIAMFGTTAVVERDTETET